MVLRIISDNEEIVGTGHFYIKARVTCDIKELHIEIMNNGELLRSFYNNFRDNTTKIDSMYEHLSYMSPSERRISISTLPPIPSFLHGQSSITLKVKESQYNSISTISKLLGTTLSNMMLVVYYISIPPELYREFPYLTMHYKFIEMYMNLYIENTNGSIKLDYYNTIQRYV